MDQDLVTQLAALAHPHRITIIRVLSRCHPQRLSAGEIAQLLSVRASTLSGYLAQLVQAGLIDSERLGTSLRYALRRQAAETMLEALVVDGFGARISPLDAPLPPRKARNVLFVCADNTTRSIMAEGLLRAHAGDRFEVFSAGITPGQAPDPQVIEHLAARGIDTDALWTKPLSALVGPDAPVMDVVVALCAISARHDAPGWPAPALGTYWAVAPTDPMTRLERQIERFCALDFGASRRAIQSGLDRIAENPET